VTFLKRQISTRKDFMSISETVKKGVQRDSFRANLAREAAILKLRYGADQVYDLTPDYPEMEPPACFDQELKKLFETPRAGLHRYMENAGYTDTRTAIAAQLKQATGLNFTMAEVIMTSGASGAINMAIKAVLNPAEEVVLFSPIDYDYGAFVANHAGVARIVPCNSDFNPDLSVLEAALTPKTKLVVINSPNNPSGAVYSEAVLKNIAAIVTRRSSAFNTRIYIVSDDSYRKFYYGPGQCPWILSYYPHTILVSSYSKELSIPGERIGYTAVSPLCEDSKVVVGGLIHANRTLGFVNAPALMQNAVSNLQAQAPDLAVYRAKLDYLYTHLVEMGYTAFKPQGAFFLLAQSPIKDDVAFATALLKQHVLTLPGSLYLAPAYFRLSYCVDQKVLQGALPGLQTTLSRYRN
jgi:aspartate aminotransferase